MQHPVYFQLPGNSLAPVWKSLAPIGNPLAPVGLPIGAKRFPDRG